MRRYRIVEWQSYEVTKYLVEIKRWYGWRVYRYGNDHLANFDTVKEAEVLLHRVMKIDNPKVERHVLYEVTQ